MSAYLSPIGNEPQSDANGNPLSGGKIFTYIAGSTTPAATFTDSTGATPQANPIILNARGCPANPIWLAGGVAYKLVITDANGVTLPPTFDNVQGINDPSAAATGDQWAALGVAPTYVSATSFSVAGDQTPVLQANRRTKSTNTSGTIYGTIISATYNGGTGLTTVVQASDSGTLDAGLSSVSYGLLSATSPSIPIYVPAMNFLDNPDGAIYQRAQAAATADGSYADDRWYVLTQTGTITPEHISNPIPGYPWTARITQSQAAPQRMGRAQVVPNFKTQLLQGRQVSVGGLFSVNPVATTLRGALLAWTGTADSVTKDVVNDWTSANYTTGNFFAAANLTLIATSNVALDGLGNTATLQMTGTVPTNATNLIWFYWTEGTAPQNSAVYATDQRLVIGTVLVSSIKRSEAQELAECLRYLPAFVGVGVLDDIATGGTQTTSAAAIEYQFLVQPRIPPTGISVSSVGHFTLSTPTVNSVATAMSFTSASNRICRLSVTGTGTPYVASQPAVLYGSNASARILFTGAEL